MTAELDFTGARVLVTGGTGGIGNGIARAFAARGAAVTVWGTRVDASAYAGEEGSDLSDLSYAQVDVTDATAVDAAAAALGAVDVVVQSQGLVLYRRQEFEVEGWERVLAVNLSSLMHIARAVRSALADAKGSMIVVSSIGGQRATLGNPAYAASKAGAINLVRTLAQGWAADGVRVNGIAPSLVDTRMTKVTMDQPDRRERALAKIPLGRFGTVEEMAGVALFLASPLAGYVCGQTIVVDGGLTL